MKKGERSPALIYVFRPLQRLSSSSIIGVLLLVILCCTLQQYESIALRNSLDRCVCCALCFSGARSAPPPPRMVAFVLCTVTYDSTIGCRIEGEHVPSFSLHGISGTHTSIRPIPIPPFLLNPGVARYWALGSLLCKSESIAIIFLVTKNNQSVRPGGLCHAGTLVSDFVPPSPGPKSKSSSFSCLSRVGSSSASSTPILSLLFFFFFFTLFVFFRTQSVTALATTTTYTPDRHSLLPHTRFWTLNVHRTLTKYKRSLYATARRIVFPHFPATTRKGPGEISGGCGLII